MKNIVRAIAICLVFAGSAFALTGEPLDAFIRQQYDVWGRNIREAGITPQ